MTVHKSNCFLNGVQKTQLQQVWYMGHTFNCIWGVKGVGAWMAFKISFRGSLFSISQNKMRTLGGSIKDLSGWVPVSKIRNLNYLLDIYTALISNNFITDDCTGTQRKSPRNCVAGWWMRDRSHRAWASEPHQWMAKTAEDSRVSHIK